MRLIFNFYILLLMSLSVYANENLPTVKCYVSFRPSPYTGPTEPFKNLTVEAKRNGSWVELINGDFRFQFAYDKNPSDGHFIKIYVWPAELNSTMPYDALSEAWYPLPDEASNINFSLSGFTGFQYVYHKTKKSELQYVCEHLP